MEQVEGSGGWVEYRTVDGKPYYHNAVTNSTQWIIPPELLWIEVKVTPGGNEKVEDWDTYSEVDENNMRPKIFFIHKFNKEKRWFRPTDPRCPAGCEKLSGEGKEGWFRVTNNDDSVFYYNHETKESKWLLPKGAGEGKAKVQPIGAMPQQSRGREEEDLVLPEESEAKKLKRDFSEDEKNNQVETIADLTTEEERKEEADAEAESNGAAEVGDEEEELSEDEYEQDAFELTMELPIEERTEMFYEMLRDNKVSSFATWESVEEKIKEDSRYRLLNSKREKKEAFETYCSQWAKEEKDLRHKELERKRAEFKEFVKCVNFKGTYKQFAFDHAGDARFKAIEKTKERQQLFADALKEIKNDDNNSSKELKRTQGMFMEMLREERSVGCGSKWKRVKEMFENDYRYLAVESSLRESYFDEYLKDMKVADRKRREEKSLRKREEEVRRMRHEDHKRAVKARGKLQREDAKQMYMSLLSEYVRDVNMGYEDAKDLLRKDDRYDDICDVLSRDRRRDYFEDHLDDLYDQKVDKYFKFLESISEISPVTEWEVARELILKENYRYFDAKSGLGEKNCCKEYRSYIRWLKRRRKRAFEDLLKETKCISEESISLIEKFKDFEKTGKYEWESGVGNDEGEEADQVVRKKPVNHLSEILETLKVCDHKK
eukprot:Nk52_evm131s226 gene=Nk52_evmTU131s226